MNNEKLQELEKELQELKERVKVTTLQIVTEILKFKSIIQNGTKE